MKLEFDFTKVIEFTNPLEGPTFEKLKRSLLTVMIRQKDKLFQQSIAPDGTPWLALSKKVASKKNKLSKKSDAEISQLQKSNPNYAQHKILIDTKTLANSITTPMAPYAVRSTAGNEVALGTNVPYAAIQNFGGTIKRSNGVEIIIPARPFIGFGNDDNKQVQEKIEATVRKIRAK